MDCMYKIHIYNDCYKVGRGNLDLWNYQAPHMND